MRLGEAARVGVVRADRWVVLVPANARVLRLRGALADLARELGEALRASVGSADARRVGGVLAGAKFYNGHQKKLLTVLHRFCRSGLEARHSRREGRRRLGVLEQEEVVGRTALELEVGNVAFRVVGTRRLV